MLIDWMNGVLCHFHQYYSCIMAASARINALSCRSCSSKIKPVLYDASPIPPMPGKSRAYFEAISQLPKYVGAVLINGLCISYMLAKNSWKNGIR